MGKLTNGFSGPLRGKLGNAVGYVVKGENRVRGRAERNKEKDREWTDGRLSTKLVSDLLRPVKEYIQFGFACEAEKHKTWNYYNAAYKYIREAIAGVYPDLYFDYSKVLFAMGDLPLPQSMEVELVERGLKFTWDTSTPQEPASISDQVMVIAYYPNIHKADFIRSGSGRSVGTEFLPLNPMYEDQIAEIYIAFISDDRSRVSNSVHLGQIKRAG